MITPLTSDERQLLLQLARDSIRCALKSQSLPDIPPESITPALSMKGASFVSLTIDSRLRGCIGSLEAHQSLVDDVREHAVQAALEDYRFPPLSIEELNQVSIEISRLTPPVPLEYSQPQDLPGLLRPGIDGVILRDGFRRATFLPQVWEQLPEPEEFLSHLCAKMGASAQLWRNKLLQVSIYQVEEFHE